MAKGRERTLTAVRSPLAQGEAATIPVLFACGQLELERGRGAPRLHVISDELVLGRGAEGDAPERGRLRLVDPLVSGQHARLARAGDGVTLEDLGSKNGTFLIERGTAARLG